MLRPVLRRILTARHPVLVDRTAGTNIGDMTGGGGLAAAFDGTKSQVSTACAYNASAAGYVGKTHAAAKIISHVVVYGANNNGYVFTVNPAMTITLYGKNGAAPASATDGTSLGSISFTDATDESAGRTIISIDQGTAWLHNWVYINDGAADAHICAELEIYEI